MSLISHLAQLESFDMIRLAQTQPDLEYLFRHALMQEAAYDSLVKTDRMRLHLTVGEALERAYADRLDEIAPLLGRHFDGAGDDRRALKYFTQAGDVAARLYANTEAVTHYTRALEIETRIGVDRETLQHLYLSLGRVYELSARDDQALLTYGEMEATARERDDRAMELAGLAARATVYIKPVSVADPEQGRALSERALALARELDDCETEVKALWNLMQYYKWTGQSDQALSHGEEALALAREHGLREQIAYVLNDIASTYAMDGRIERARVVIEEARQCWRELGILNMLADSLATSAELEVMVGDYERAIALSGEALRVSRSIGNLWNQSYSWYMIDLAYLDRGEVDQAIDAAEECLRLAQPAGFVPGMLQSIFDLVLIYGSIGAFKKASEVAERLRGMWMSMTIVVPFSRLVEVSLRMWSGDLSGARVALEESKRGFEQEVPRAFSLWLLGLIEAGLLMAEGNYAQMHDLAIEATLFLRQAGIRLFLPDALYYRGVALSSLARADEARDALTEARAEAEAIGSRRMLWQILAALSELEAQRGNHAEADSLRDRAREIVDYIAEHVSSPELRASFLNLPGVRAVLEDRSE